MAVECGVDDCGISCEFGCARMSDVAGCECWCENVSLPRLAKLKVRPARDTEAYVDFRLGEGTDQAANIVAGNPSPRREKQDPRRSGAGRIGVLMRRPELGLACTASRSVLVNQGDQPASGSRATSRGTSCPRRSPRSAFDAHTAASGSRVILGDLQRLSPRPFGLEQPEATMRRRNGR
jgi:hypothetical protein